MSQANNLLKNTIIYAVGNFGSKVFSFALLPVFSFFLTKAQLGIYDLLITTLNLSLPIISLQISDAVYRWLLDYKHNSKEQSKIIKQALIILISSLFISQILIYIISYFYKFPYRDLYSLLILFSCLLPFAQQIVRGMGYNKLYSVSGVINSCLILFISIFFLFTNFVEDKVEGIFIALILANAITFIFIFIFIRINKKVILHEPVDFKFQLSLLKYSLPLIFNAISWWVINASSRFIILEFMQIEDNGIYAVSTRLPALLTIINSVFMLAWQDMIIADQKKENPFFTELFNKYFIFVICISLICLSASPFIVYYLFDNKFYEAWKYVPFLFMGAAFSSISAFVGAAYLKAKETKGVLITSIIAAVINILISVGLIKYIGLYAPAIGTFVSFVVMLIIRIIDTRKMLVIKINLVQTIGLSLITILFTFILIYSQSKTVSAILTSLSLMLFIYLNYDLLKNLMNKITLRIR